MTERTLPQTPEDVADEVLRYLSRHRRVFETHGTVRSIQFTVKFGRDIGTPRQRFFSVEAEPRKT